LQNINLEPSDLFNLSFGNSFSGSNLFCFFYSNQQTTFPLLHYGNLLVGVPRIILIVQDEERIETSPVSVKISVYVELLGKELCVNNV